MNGGPSGRVEERSYGGKIPKVEFCRESIYVKQAQNCSDYCPRQKASYWDQGSLRS